MKKVLILLSLIFGAVMSHYLIGAPDGQCDGKGKYATQHGVYGYWCPHENGDSDCVYKKPKGGCPTKVGVGGGTAQ